MCAHRTCSKNVKFSLSYLDELPERLLRLDELREPDDRLRDRELAEVELLDDEYL